VALLIAFLFGYGLDAAIRALSEQAATTFRFESVFLLGFATSFVIAAMMLMLAWLLFIRLAPSRAASGVFPGLGLLLVALHVAAFLPGPEFVRETPLGTLQSALISTGFHNLFSLASFCVIAGIAGLIFPDAGRSRGVD
jgi:hypothetical protein